MIQVNFEYNGVKLVLSYADDGKLKYVTNVENNEKLMVEYTQVGEGYEFTEHNGYIPMDMCNAVYVRIIKLNVFVPKFIFIPNE